MMLTTGSPAGEASVSAKIAILPVGAGFHRYANSKVNITVWVFETGPRQAIARTARSVQLRNSPLDGAERTCRVLRHGSFKGKRLPDHGGRIAPRRGAGRQDGRLRDLGWPPPKAIRARPPAGRY